MKKGKTLISLLLVLMILTSMFPIGAISEGDMADAAVVELTIPDEIADSDAIEIELGDSDAPQETEDLEIEISAGDDSDAMTDEPVIEVIPEDDPIEEPPADDSGEIEIVLPEEPVPETDPPAEVNPDAPMTTEESLIPDSPQPFAEIGDFLWVTTQTRVYMDVDDSVGIGYDGDMYLGNFLRDAAVQVDAVQRDSFGGIWYRVAYCYGPEENGEAFNTAINSVYVLEDEVFPTDETELGVTDYGYPAGYFRPMLLAFDSFDLKNNSGGIASYYVGESGLHATTGHDNEYLQIARHDEYGTIYATPHYLKGQTAYCLEHTQNSPVVRDHDSGPYEIVDLAGYRVTPGHSGYIFSDKTMHALAWVLRHTYPFMVVDRSDADNRVWSRVAGQFAIREVVKQIEGAYYVREYWEMDEFYRPSDYAPGVYLEYARWLAEEALAYADTLPTIEVYDQSVMRSGNQYVGTVTLYTSAAQMRIPKSAGTITGNSGGDDWEYYYLYSGDTVSLTSQSSTFSMTVEALPSPDDEAAFYVGVTYADIQKLLLPVEGDPYPVAEVSIEFEVPHGAVRVVKQSEQTGALLPGAVFELLDSAGSVVQTQTTGADGSVTFANLTPGAYTIREKSAPQGYLLGTSNTQSVTVSAGSTSNVAFSNNVMTSKIRIAKTDALTGEALPGAQFTITRLSAVSGVSGVGNVVATITTGADGTAETGWLEWGRYRITETKAPEHFENDSFVTEVDAYENGKTYTFSVSNAPKPGYIRLTKTDVNRGTLLKGVQFDIYHADQYGSGLAGTMVTDANGVATSDPLRKGTYRIEEHANPQGYTGELVTLDAEVFSDQTTELSATNAPIQGKIRIVKRDELTGELLSGAEFTITRIASSDAANGAGVGETIVITTDASGVAETGWLDYGTYRIEETKVPEHFVDNGFSVEVNVHEHEKTYTVEANNEPTKGFIQIVKTDALDRHPIEGVRFDIFYADQYGEGLATTMTTNKDGVAISPPLRKGVYKVVEHENPTGYVTELNQQPAIVYSDETTHLFASNQPIQGQIQIVKRDELTKEALAGAEFTITRISGLPSHKGAGDGEVVAIVTTDADGLAISPLLTWGTYRVQETGVPEHFVDNDFSCDVTIDVEDLQIYTIEVENEPTKGFIRLSKTDRLTGNPIAGVKFEVYYNDIYGEGLATTLVTDENGVAMSEPLRKGQYMVIEQGAMTGYFFEEVRLDAIVKSDETTELSATNQPVQIQIAIHKRDADEYADRVERSAHTFGAPAVRGDGVLTGAEFQVLAAADILDRQGGLIHSRDEIVIPSIKTEGDEAIALTDALWPGEYKIVELTPPEGYLPSDELVFVDTRDAANQSELAVVTYNALKTNKIKMGAQAIVKILGSDVLEPDADRVEVPEPGAEFEVYLKRAGSYENAREFERDYLITDENGYAKSKALPYGVYVLRQVKGAEGYEIKGRIEFTIDGTEDIAFPPIMTLSDRPILYRLKLTKTDAETGNVVTLPGASFKLTDAEGNPVVQTVHYPVKQEIDMFVTDETGTVMLPETLTWGMYFITEVKAPNGYLLHEGELGVFVGRDGDTPDNTYELSVEIPNEPVKGRIVLHKKGLRHTGFEQQTDAYGNTVHKPVFEEAYLAGAVFEVRAAEQIVGGDGTVWYEPGDLADTITTTETGNDMSKELPLGNYVLVETQLPEGYVGDNKLPVVNLAYADQHTAVVEISTEIHNTYLPAEVTLTKLKEAIQTTADGGGVTRQVVTVPGEGCVFGLFMADGRLVATGATDADGKLTFDGLYPHGEYTIQELSAPDGWKLDAAAYPVSLIPGNKAETENVIRVELPDPILNELIHTPVTLTKTDITGENTIPGAVIEVLDANGDLVYRAETNEHGEIPDIPLVPGSYTFYEVLAPEGYALNEAEMAFTVHADGTITGDTTIRDDYTRVQIVKQDEDGQLLAGATFALRRESGEVLMTAASNANGLVTFERILHGSFIIEEVSPAPGYLPSDEKIRLTVDGTFVNPAQPLATMTNYANEALIRKVDQRGKALPGAAFGLFNETGERVMTAVSDDDGIVRFEKIPNGEYTISEIAPPNGYLRNKETVHLTVDASYENSGVPIVTLTNHLKRMRYQKVDTSGKYLSGVEFSLINASTGEIVETVVSDDHGEFVFTKFDYGDWIIRETKAPEGYMKMDDLTLHVGDDWKEPEPFTCVNIPNHYEFIKVDRRGNPIPGVRFALEDKNGNFLRELESGEDGIVHVTGLVPGSYVIRETEPAEGYELTDETIELVIDEKYKVPKRMKRIKNYAIVDESIQTGVDIEVTPVMIAGAGVIVLACAFMIVHLLRNKKK